MACHYCQVLRTLYIRSHVYDDRGSIQRPKRVNKHGHQVVRSRRIARLGYARRTSPDLGYKRRSSPTPPRGAKRDCHYDIGGRVIDGIAIWLAVASGPASIPDSAYTGPWYVHSAEPFRKCVMWRESHGRYKADGQYGSGAYQFIQSTWNAYAKLAGLAEWVGIRPYKAPATVQDTVFWRAYWRGKGKHHWSPTHALTIGKSVKSCT